MACAITSHDDHLRPPANHLRKSLIEDDVIFMTKEEFDEAIRTVYYHALERGLQERGA